MSRSWTRRTSRQGRSWGTCVAPGKLHSRLSARRSGWREASARHRSLPLSRRPQSPSTPGQMDPKLKALEEERSQVYGDPQISHTSIGLAWEGVFRNRYQDLEPHLGPPGFLFPDELVALM